MSSGGQWARQELLDLFTLLFFLLLLLLPLPFLLRVKELSTF